MNNSKLAQLIYSVATYDGYNTSVLQTAKNLSSNKTEWRFESESDRYIFEDLLKAVVYASSVKELTIESLKGINAQMDSKEKGQPDNPGVLRKNVSVVVGEYYPSEKVTEEMVTNRIKSILDYSISSGWELYAKLAKLQAFDDGNKRTALIAANLWIGAFSDDNSDYLVIPTDYRRARFDANLVDFYMADDWDDHLPNIQESLDTFVSFATETTLLQKNNDNN